MKFTRIDPEPALSRIIECYWIAEENDVTVHRQKIIPDGFTEIIFHFGDPYRINIRNVWELQPIRLVAGQINRHFFLENTGTSSILGIKLRPAALAALYPIEMRELTDQVVELYSVIGPEFTPLERDLHNTPAWEDRIAILNRYFKALYSNPEILNPVDGVVDHIMINHGMVEVAGLGEIAGVGVRQLENLFGRHVGLSPKRFARIFRFNYIFELIRQPPHSWSDLVYSAAFYDQSHFIRNFKDFTGENPADYSFDEKNMANFFLKKR